MELSRLDMLILALLLDAVLGDPAWLWSRLPHPAALMGRLVAWLDKGLNRGRHRRARGVLAVAVLVLAAGGIGALPAQLPGGAVIEVLAAAVLLSQNSLSAHVRAVAAGLGKGLREGRARVALIVGRDPDTLDEAGVARAAIESAAENFSDGTVAPALWFLLGGLPGMAIYKAVNTADSMIGHRTRRHAAFGWAAARLDDLLNLIPARLAGGLIALSHLSPRAFRVMLRDAPRHRSPNAGWPEAATAALVGVAISGPRSYGGRIMPQPWVHGEGRRAATPGDINRAVRIIWRAWAMGLGLLVAARLAVEGLA